MTTVRQIERAWKAQQYERLFADLAANRPETLLRAKPDGGWVAVAAAMALIRLDELGQSHVPLCTALIHAVVAAQQVDGGWGDLVTTPICLRALLAASGHGLSIDRGMVYLANLQKSEGIWPGVPLRRMPQDTAVSALVLFELADQPTFHAAVRVEDAMAWYQSNKYSIEPDCRALWHRASLRCQRYAVARPVLDWIAA